MGHLESIRDIYPDKAFVIIECRGREPIAITADEAIDRAEALAGLTTEDERGRHVKDLHNALMDSAAHARQYGLSLKGADYVEFAIKVKNARALELYKAYKHTGVHPERRKPKLKGGIIIP